MDVGVSAIGYLSKGFPGSLEYGILTHKHLDKVDLVCDLHLFVAFFFF